MLESLWILKLEVHPSARRRENNRGEKTNETARKSNQRIW